MVLMALAMFFLSLNDVLFKYLGEFMPMGQAIALRGVPLCALLGLILLGKGQRPRLTLLTNRWCLLRASCELVATFLFLFSLLTVNLAIATTLVFTSPIILTAVSAPLFGEKVGPWRWFAVLGGFIGVVLITWNSNGAFDTRLLMPLGAGAMVAARDIVTRYIPEEIPAESVTLTTSIVVLTAALFTIPAGWNSEVSLTNIGLAILAAVFVGIAFVCTINALRLGELSLIAPVQYVVIIFAVVNSFVFFADIPGSRSLAGGLIIVASGLLIVYRERVARLRT